MGFRSLISCLPAISATRRLAFALVGLSPTERVSLRWTHEQERLAQTVSFWCYSFCEENRTERNCPCVQLPDSKSQSQSQRLGYVNCAQPVLGISSRFPFCSCAPPGSIQRRSPISSSARARASLALSRPTARANWMGNELTHPRHAEVAGSGSFVLCSTFRPAP